MHRWMSRHRSPSRFRDHWPKCVQGRNSCTHVSMVFALFFPRALVCRPHSAFTCSDAIHANTQEAIGSDPTRGISLLARCWPFARCRTSLRSDIPRRVTKPSWSGRSGRGGSGPCSGRRRCRCPYAVRSRNPRRRPRTNPCDYRSGAT